MEAQKFSENKSESAKSEQCWENHQVVQPAWRFWLFIYLTLKQTHKTENAVLSANEQNSSLLYWSAETFK